MHDLIYIFVVPAIGALSIFAWEKYQARRREKAVKAMIDADRRRSQDAAKTIRDNIDPAVLGHYIGESPKRDTLRSIEHGPYAKSESPDESA